MLARSQAGFGRIVQVHEASHVYVGRVISEAAGDLANAKDAAERDIDTSLFEGFTLRPCDNRLTVINFTTWELPSLKCGRSKSLLDHQHMLTVRVNDDC